LRCLLHLGALLLHLLAPDVAADGADARAEAAPIAAPAAAPTPAPVAVFFCVSVMFAQPLIASTAAASIRAQVRVFATMTWPRE
jgi:hypothetical protein